MKLIKAKKAESKTESRDEKNEKEENNAYQLELLGKKSFFLESKVIEFEKRWKLQEIIIDEVKTEWLSMTPEQKLVINKKRIAHYPFRSVHPPDYIQSSPMETKKQEFFNILKEKKVIKEQIAVEESLIERNLDDVESDDDKAFDDMSVD